MRHTAASWLMQDGVPLYDVQALLGHEDYATTQGLRWVSAHRWKLRLAHRDLLLRHLALTRADPAAWADKPQHVAQLV